MFGPLGLPEILLILGLALLVFGPRRLPEMGRTLGRALGEFRRATTDLKRSVQFEMDAEDDRQRRDRLEREREEREKREAAAPKELGGGTIADSTLAPGDGSESPAKANETGPMSDASVKNADSEGDSAEPEPSDVR